MKTIIRLNIVEIYRPDNTYYKHTIGYYSSYEIVERIINDNEFIREDILYITEELPLDKYEKVEENYGNDCITFRQYSFKDNSFVMTHETRYDFNGYKDDNDYQYKVGDIIEYLGRNNEIYIGIVGGIPLKYDLLKERYMESYDDSYILYSLGEGDTHEHIMAINIIGLPSVSPDTVKAYKDKLEERKQTWTKTIIR